MMRLLVWIKTKLKGQLVGSDEFGNLYYQCDTSARAFGRKDRWVVYKGDIDASKIPSLWFNWLHYQTDKVPTNHKKMNWEKLHQRNITGTPASRAAALDFRPPSRGDYQPWEPNKI